jgi:hypothetical protein
MRKQYISGIRIGSYLDDVREFTQQQPKYVGCWGRADCIYNWIGSIIRLKRRHWKGGKPTPYGIVIEVGSASWLAALWTDSRTPDEPVAPCDIDRWWPTQIHQLKNDMLARRFTEEQLLHFLRILNYTNLTPVS